MNAISRTPATALVIALVLTAFVATVRATASEDNRGALGPANNAFACDVYAKLKGQEGNLFFSPFSVSSALALAYAGARGGTEQEMAKVLHFSSDSKLVHKAFGAVIKDLNNPEKTKGLDLAVANGLWLAEGSPLLKEYVDLVTQEYGAGLKELNFAGAPEPSTKEINQWVAQRTGGRITDLVPPGLLGPSTKLVITNAIYFKGAWISPFPKQATTEARFTTLDGKEIQVPMMHETGDFPYAEDDSVQLLDLPYTGNGISMLIVLPKKKDGLVEFERNLSAERLRELTATLGPSQVSLFLPRFKMTRKVFLGEALQEMGMKDAFSLGAADFSGINGKRDFAVSQVIHEAFVDVNEEGTEAAAATAMTMKGTMAPTSPKEFRADHPFFFMIRDKKSESILFMGRLTNPAK